MAEPTQTQAQPKEGQREQADGEKGKRKEAEGDAPGTKEKEKEKVDGKTYYGYLFENDKKPTKVLDSLLRGVAGYISESIGDPEQKNLTPDKMAAFYKAVGGNYDSLFVALPPPSISWIYASIGCQHTLQPHPHDDFIPPCIPALTTRGFVRWQSIEILLGPEEHAPFIMTSLQNFNIRNPDTGEPFPTDLPRSAFPEHADPDIEKWHEQCAKALRKRATPKTEDEGSMSEGGGKGAKPDMPPRPTVQRDGFAHVNARPRPEYFDRRRGSAGGRPVSYQHVSSSAAAPPPPNTANTTRPVRPRMSRSPSHRARQFLAPEDTAGTRGRRRSFPEPMDDDLRGPDLNGRRHSHSHSGGPRHKRRGSMSSDASSEDESDISPGHTPTPGGHIHRHVPSRERSRSHPAMRPGEKEYADRPLNSHSNSRSSERERERVRERDRTDIPIPPSGVRYAVPPPSQRHERDRGRDREGSSKRRSYPIPTSTGVNPNIPANVNAVPISIDPTGKLSTPFLASKRSGGISGGPDLRSDSHSRTRGVSTGGSNVHWRDLDAMGGKVKEWWSHRGKESEEEVGGSGRVRRERSGVRERDVGRKSSYEDSGGNSSSRKGERERERRERDAVRDPIARDPSARRSGGEGRSYRERERDRERDRDRDIRGVDGRTYPAARGNGGGGGY